MVKNPQKMSHLNIQFSSRGPKQKYKKVENFWRENCIITRFAKSNPTCETFSSIFNQSAQRNFYLRRAAGKKDWVPSDGQPDWFSINNWTHNSYLSSDILLQKALFSEKKEGKTSVRANFGNSGQKKVNQELGFWIVTFFLCYPANEFLSRNLR